MTFESIRKIPPFRLISGLENAFAKEEINKKGKRIRKYPDSLIMTPYQKLRSLPHAEQYLKSGITLKILDDFAHQYSDNEAARKLNQARNALFQSFNNSQNYAA